MRARDSVYHDLKYRVKINHFTEKGFDINGVVHVGANDGYEVSFYLQLGMQPVVCFEPLPKALNLLKQNYMQSIESGDVVLFPFALGNVNEVRPLRISPDTGQMSTFLEDEQEYLNNHKDADFTSMGLGTINCEVKRFIDVLNDPLYPKVGIDCLVVDVQGMELDVLKGMEDKIKNLKFLNIECSRVPIYKGGVSAQQVIDYLSDMGFKQDSPIEDHNDIMFIRKDLCN